MDELQKDVAAVARIDVVPTILEVVCRTTGMGFAAVARVTEDRWVACAVRDEIKFGLVPGGELEVATTICNEIRGSGNPVVIDHVVTDQGFCNHPTPARYGFQSYISMPILRKDGSFFGTLCAIDPKPATLKTPQTIGMFTLFAELIGFHLDTQERLSKSEAALLGERQTAELREQFIAVLGHDLRNPLAALDAGTRQLEKVAVDERSREIALLMHKSITRMAGLIDNVLDLTRARLGGGVTLNWETSKSLAAALGDVVQELSASYPDRQINLATKLREPIVCDPPRIAQLLSNLLANALSHGAVNKPISVIASTEDGVFQLSVANQGTPIAPTVMARLFEPFYRARDGAGTPQGLGLGLYIASEIARAHGGTLNVTSVPELTTFVFVMPIKRGG